MKRKQMSKNASKALFARTANRTRAINLYGVTLRGGKRL